MGFVTVIGNITNPFGTLKIPGYTGGIGESFGLILFLNNIVKLVVVMGGIYAFINLIVAGYAFMSAAGDPQKVTFAWNKIWQTLLGLMIIAGSFTLAAIFGLILFNNASIILNPPVFGPQ